MVNVARLRDLIKKSNHTIASLSHEIGMDDSTFYRKLNTEGTSFTLAQADAIAKALHLDAKTAQDIFFCPATRISAS